MKRYLFLFFIVFIICIDMAGQAKTSKRNWGNNSCVYLPKYSAASRLKIYPFNIADTIKLVSFRHQYENYPIKKDTVISDSLIEVKVLNQSEINQLTDILFNNFYKKFNGINTITQCFSPRNAILFIDKHGKIKEHILICFHCSNFSSPSHKYDLLGEACDEKMDKLRKYFIVQGIKFGTDKSIDEYPGETFKGEPIIFPPPKD